MKNSTGILQAEAEINEVQNSNLKTIQSNKSIENLLSSWVRKLNNIAMQKEHLNKNNTAVVNIPSLKKNMENAPRQSERNAKQQVKLKLHIKNMVSTSCKIVVSAVLENLGISYSSVELGEAELTENLSDQQREQLKQALRTYGFELIETKQSILVDKIIRTIIEMIHSEDELPKTKISNYLSDKLNYDYTYLSNRFSAIQGSTIEQYVIFHKIERIKQLILFGELTLDEIAWKLQYSSAAHLSNQFKKITGLTPSNFKKLKDKNLIAFENL